MNIMTNDEAALAIAKALGIKETEFSNIIINGKRIFEDGVKWDKPVQIAVETYANKKEG